MVSFDIDSLLRFTPPQYLCERCFALMAATPDVRVGRCPVCGVSYVATHEFRSCDQYLDFKGLGLHYDDLMGHTRKLAQIARHGREAFKPTVTSDYSPMRVLLQAMSEAQQFIHFTTFGISALILGSLRLAAQRVPVRGIVSGLRNEAMLRELNEYGAEAPLMQTRVLTQEDVWLPHQKLIVIDGLVAFKGSANLTDIGWRKAAEGREVIDVVTDIREITELHNRFFSATWAAYEGLRPGMEVQMSTF